MCMNSQAIHPGKPLSRSRPAETTARPRAMYAAEPRSRYLNGSATRPASARSPSPPARSASPASSRLTRRPA